MRERAFSLRKEESKRNIAQEGQGKSDYSRCHVEGLCPNAAETYCK